MILSWTSQLASESRDWGWIDEFYVEPDSVRRVLRQLDMMKGGVIGLVGLQGVGKSSALTAIYRATNSIQGGGLGAFPRDTILFK
jgi:ABC-type sugar transport system ATPase subunit